MAQKLHPLSLVAIPPKPMNLRIDTRAFHNGWVDGLTQLKPRGFDLSQPSEEILVAILVNIAEIAREKWDNEEEVLRYYGGIIAACLLRKDVGVGV